MDNFDRKNGNINRDRTTVNSLDIMVSAMWELMIEKGFSREQLNAKLDEIKEQRVTLDPRQSKVVCPGCGRTVSEVKTTPFEGTCIYCGQKVTIYPGDSIVFAKDTESITDNGLSTPEDQDGKE